MAGVTFADAAIKLEILLEISLGSPIGQLRSMPVCLGEGAPRSFLVVYAADFDLDGDDVDEVWLVGNADPLYVANQRLSGVGYNLPVLGGL